MVRVPEGKGGNKKPTGDPALMALLNGNLFEFFFRLLTGDSGWFGSNGFIGSAFARIVEAATLQGMRWDQVDDLQDETQKLLGVIGYGCWYAESDITDFVSASKVDFDQQIGPAVGCSNSGSGTVTLESKGLWRIDALINVDSRIFGDSNVQMEIRVYQPDGTTLHSSKLWRGIDDGRITMQNIMSVVVPTSGYKVEVWVLAGTVRLMRSGINYNGLNVTKVSDETT